MEVILLSDIDKLGFADDVVIVKDGFARNFLIPQGKAVVKNSSNLAMLKERNKIRDKKEAAQLANIEELISKLKDVNLQIGAKVGSNNKLFGSVNNIQIADALAKKGIEIDRRKLAISEGEVKELGSYTVVVTLTPDHIVEIPLEIIAE